MPSTSKTCWGIVWRSKNSLDGTREFLQWDRLHSRTGPVMFETRREAREYRDKKYGYIKGRADLKAEPHGWKVPGVVRVRATYESV
jgi:hypothetical protein